MSRMNWLEMALHYPGNGACDASDYKQLMTVAQDRDQMFILGTKPQRIYKYDAGYDEWNEISTNLKFDAKDNHLLLFDEKKKMIYSWVPLKWGGQIVKEYDIEKKIEQKKWEENSAGYNSMIIVDNMLHLIGSKKHIIFDLDKETKCEVERDYETDFEFKTESVYLKSKRTIVFLDTQNAEMHSLQTKSNKWVKSSINCPEDMKRIFSVHLCDSSGQYIVCFGGTRRINDPDAIYVFDCNLNKLSQTDIKPPFIWASCYSMMRDPMREELMVYGFVNDCWKSAEYENMQKLPTYLIQLISQWICDEWLHVITPANGKHWKMHIDEIIRRYV